MDTYENSFRTIEDKIKSLRYGNPSAHAIGQSIQDVVTQGHDSLPDNSFKFNDAVQLAKAKVAQFSALVSSYNAQDFPNLLKKLKKQYDSIDAAEDAYADSTTEVKAAQSEQAKLEAKTGYDKQRDSELTQIIKERKTEARQALEAKANIHIADLDKPNDLAREIHALSNDILETKMRLKEMFSELNADYLKSNVTIVIPAPYVSSNSLEQFTLTVTDNYKPLVWKETAPQTKNDDGNAGDAANTPPSPSPAPSGTSASLQLSAATSGAGSAKAAPVQVSKTDNGTDTSTVTASFIVPFHRVVHFAAIGGFLAVRSPRMLFRLRL